tara:strand:- start:805 stop:2904 length:2100 start_codon:yes stop_codon:yes gene_type:complete
MSETFINGSGTRVNLPKDAGPNPEVTAVEVKERESSFAFTPLERGKWSVSTSSSAAGPVTVVVFKNPYPAIKVFYTRNSTQEEVADVLGKDTADAMAAQSAKMEAQSKAILKDLQFDKINLEGVSTKNFEEAGGFKGIQDFAKSFQGVTKRPMLAKATQNLGDGSAKGVSGQLSSIKAITGGKGASGFLKKFTTQMNASSTKKITKKTFPKFTDKKLNTLISKVAINASKAEVSLEPQNDPKLKANNEVQKIYKAKVKNELNNCGAKLDPLSPFGGLGRPNLNCAAQLVAKAKGIAGTGSGDIEEIVQGARFSPEKVKNLIDKGLNTNIRSNISKGDLVSASPTNKVSSSTASNGFAGFNTPASYVFKKIASPDELYTKLSTGPRTLTTGKDKIGCIIFGWTKHLVGSPSKVDAAEVHRLTKIFDRSNLVETLGSTEKADERIGIKPKKFGIQPHYIVLRNGDIQEGRPLDVTRNGDYARYSLSGVKVAFVASDTAPVTPKQMESFNIIIKVWLRVFPAGQVFSDFEIDNEYDGPGFNAKEVVKSIHDVEFLTTSPSDLEEMPDPRQLAMTKPNKIAKSTQGGSFPKDIDQVDKEIAQRLESEAFQKDVANAQNVLKNETGTAINNMNSKIDELDAAGKLPAGIGKALKDSKIGNLEGLVKNSGGKIDGVVNSLQSLPNQTLAQKEGIAKNLFNKFSLG